MLFELVGEAVKMVLTASFLSLLVVHDGSY
jgi:hypothetical protein